MTKDGNMRKHYAKYLVGFMERKELNRHREKEKATEQTSKMISLKCKFQENCFEALQG